MSKNWFEKYAENCYNRTKNENVIPSKEYNFYMWIYDSKGNKTSRLIKTVNLETKTE